MDGDSSCEDTSSHDALTTVVDPVLTLALRDLLDELNAANATADQAARLAQQASEDVQATRVTLLRLLSALEPEGELSRALDALRTGRF